jgi:hypothetical protein
MNAGWHRTTRTRFPYRSQASLLLPSSTFGLKTMKPYLVLLASQLLISPAYADVSISTDKLEVTDDCVRLETSNVKIDSDDCKSGKGKKHEHENRSVHGDNNPGKGHDKSKK